MISPIGQLGLIEIGYIDPLDAAGTAGGAVDPCDNVEEGGFSGAGRAHEGEELTLSDVEGDAVESGDLDVALSVDFSQLANNDDRFHAEDCRTEGGGFPTFLLKRGNGGKEGRDRGR